jgi:hypothetical protein
MKGDDDGSEVRIAIADGKAFAVTRIMKECSASIRSD